MFFLLQKFSVYKYVNLFLFHLQKRWISKREFECKINRNTIVEIYDDEQSLFFLLYFSTSKHCPINEFIDKLKRHELLNHSINKKCISLKCISDKKKYCSTHVFLYTLTTQNCKLTDSYIIFSSHKSLSNPRNIKLYFCNNI